MMKDIYAFDLVTVHLGHPSHTSWKCMIEIDEDGKPTLKEVKE